MAVNAAAPQAPIDLTTATSPNQIFTLGTAAGLSMPSANLRMAPIAGTGAAGSLGDGGAASAAQFDLSTSSLFQRSGINIAPDGTIYIADTGNATIRAISGPSSTEPGVIRSVAGRWAARQNLALVEPMGLALDRAGNLYIADHAANSIDILYGANSAKSGDLETFASFNSPTSVAVTPDAAPYDSEREWRRTARPS